MTQQPFMNHLTVHMIGNAHLDPVWLWHWQQGADEAVGTCRAACDLLDEFGDAVFTRGEAWVYQQVLDRDPELFERIRAHIAAGRWEVTGGWWIQADDLTPTTAALRQNIRLGQEWFRQHLGLADLRVAYLVDSFGHAPCLPEILRTCGQEYFVFCRPDVNQMPLPSNLFRWRGSADGPEVLAYRIPVMYWANLGNLEQQVRSSIEQAPPGLGHVMCFYGVGDHGGGPTRRMLEWIRAHRDFAPGVRLEFSSIGRFFAAVEPSRAACPVVEGELGPCFPGCYSAARPLKATLRAAELALDDAANMLERSSHPQAPALRRELTEAWRTVCFNQFHDIVTGTATREALEVALRQAGGARERAEELLYRLSRHRSARESGSVRGQRLHLLNRSGRRWQGVAECEVWIDWWNWVYHFEDANGRIVPSQKISAATLTETYPIPRLAVPLDLAPNELATLRLVPGVIEDADLPGQAPALQGDVLDNGLLRVHLGAQGIQRMVFADGDRAHEILAAPLLFQMQKDGSNAWSMGLDRYDGEVLAVAAFGAPVVLESGPLLLRVALPGELGGQRAVLLATLCRGESVVHLELKVNYAAPLSVLKAVVNPARRLAQRQDRLAGGWATRACDGLERYAHHAVRLDGEPGLGLVLPDSYALDATPEAIRPTLLRNYPNAMLPNTIAAIGQPRELVHRFSSDDGPHAIRLSLAAGPAATRESLEQLVDRFLRPPVAWDDFLGVSRQTHQEQCEKG
jgi:alpha-mannosidase